MKTPLKSCVLAILLLASVHQGSAMAGEDATECRGALSPAGRLMFDAVAPHVQVGSDLPALMRSHVRPLVMRGTISRSQAQANARAVGACLRLLQR